VNHHSSRYEGSVSDVDIPGYQGATGDHRIVADPRIVRDVSGSHDVVAVADYGFRFRFRASRDGVVLSDLVVVADSQVASFAGEILVQGICAEHGTGRNFVSMAHRCPSLDEHIGFDYTRLSDRDVAFHNAEFSNYALWTDDNIRMNPRC